MTPLQESTTATGPKYRPVFIAPKKPVSTRQDLGKLQQLPTSSTHPSSRRNVPNHRPTTPLITRNRSRTPTYDEGNYEDLYDDEAWYNIDGEGNF